MLETPPTGTRAPSEPGLAEHFRAFAVTSMDYLGARLQLAGIESKEASGHYLKIVAFAAVAVAAVVFGYVFLCVSIAFILATLLKAQWMWIMLGFAVVHLAGAGLCLWLAKKRLGAPMFTETLNEFKKDRQWLNRKSF